MTFLFDLNGTMIDDMGFHLIAWHDMLNNELGAKLSKEEVKVQMYGKNEELLVRVFGEGYFTQERMDEIAMEKEKRYQEAFLPHLDLIPGLFDFLEQAKKKNIKMAICSAAIPFNINFVIDNLKIRHYFQAIVSANDVVKSKPHPETFLKAAEILNSPINSCIVFEDAPKGVEAALNAKMDSVVLTTMHDPEEFKIYPNVIRFVKDYTDPSFINDLAIRLNN